MSEHKQDAADQHRYTLAYRAAEARQVMGWIKAGQSGCLVGLRGAGRSNFLHFLLREDVRQYYLGQSYVDFALVLIDLLALTDHAEWAVYELILDRLSAQFGSLGIEPEIAKEIELRHQDVMWAMNPLMAQRTVERCVDALCRKPAQHVVLFFDEFDAVFGTVHSLFRCLRAARDAHKGQVSYIVAVTSELAYQRDNIDEAEHFYRLVSRNVCGLGPYSEADARQMIGYLASQRSIELSEQDTTRLIGLSGGHAGLLKAILGPLEDVHQESDKARLILALQNEPTVQAECRKIWNGLLESERTAVCNLASAMQADSTTFNRLELKGLIPESHSDSPILFSPLFADFCRQHSPPSKEGMVIDRSLRIVIINGQRVELTELEFEMLCYLYEHQGRVCTKDELIENVYHQQYERMVGGVTDEALQILISRLRAKIEPPRYILTVRGEGYKFVGPRGR